MIEKNVSVTIDLPKYHASQMIMPPTRQCTICEKYENPEANLIIGHTWICPSCAEKIGKLIGVRTAFSVDRNI
jgi:hypothetical protein